MFVTASVPAVTTMLAVSDAQAATLPAAAAALPAANVFVSQVAIGFTKNCGMVGRPRGRLVF